MSVRRTTLIVPVESQVRELDAKILLAAAAAERGFPVVLGSRAFVHQQMGSLPRGVYLAKSMRKLSDRMFVIIRKLGHEIVAWDEEALVRFPDDFYYRQRLSARALTETNHLVAWGEDDAACLRAFPDYPGTPVHVTGNPRIDLLRPELRGFFDDEVREIRRRHGEFVLVNTNFSWVNHFYPKLSQAEAARRRQRQGRSDPFEIGRSAHKAALFEHFRKALPALSEALPKRTLVVRPHPAEGHEAWKRAAAGLGNVHVVNDGNVVAWLIAARGLVHNGCTTAVEAAVLGTPSVAFQPVTDEAYDDALPNALSQVALDLPQLQSAVRDLVDGTVGLEDAARLRTVLDPHLAALDGPIAADRMVQVLVDAGYLSHTPPRPALGRRLRGRIHLGARGVVKQINQRRPGHRNNFAYHHHRFPGTSVEDIGGRIHRLGRQLGRFENLRIARLSEHVFRIEKA